MFPNHPRIARRLSRQLRALIAPVALLALALAAKLGAALSTLPY
jgi:hypothetical protein